MSHGVVTHVSNETNATLCMAPQSSSKHPGSSPAVGGKYTVFKTLGKNNTSQHYLVKCGFLNCLKCLRAVSSQTNPLRIMRRMIHHTDSRQQQSKRGAVDSCL